VTTGGQSPTGGSTVEPPAAGPEPPVATKAPPGDHSLSSAPLYRRQSSYDPVEDDTRSAGSGSGGDATGLEDRAAARSSGVLARDRKDPGEMPAAVHLAYQSLAAAGLPGLAWAVVEVVPAGHNRDVAAGGAVALRATGPCVLPPQHVCFTVPIPSSATNDEVAAHVIAALSLPAGTWTSGGTSSAEAAPGAVPAASPGSAVDTTGARAAPARWVVATTAPPEQGLSPIPHMVAYSGAGTDTEAV